MIPTIRRGAKDKYGQYPKDKQVGAERAHTRLTVAPASATQILPEFEASPLAAIATGRGRLAAFLRSGSSGSNRFRWTHSVCAEFLPGTADMVPYSAHAPRFQ